jgi:hypothetical protein
MGETRRLEHYWEDKRAEKLGKGIQFNNLPAFKFDCHCENSRKGGVGKIKPLPKVIFTLKQHFDKKT